MTADELKGGLSWWHAVLLATAAILLSQGLVHLAGLLRAAAGSGSTGDAISAAASSQLNLALAQATAFGIVIAIALRDEDDLTTRLGIHNVDPRTFMFALLAGFCLQFPLAEVGNWAQEVWPIPLEEQLRLRRMLTADDAWEGMTIALAFIAVAPLAEELLFRGVLLRGLRERYGEVLAIVGSAVLFGLVHISPVAIVYASVAGLVLGWFSVRMASIVPCVALHAGVNSAAVLIPERLVSLPGFNTIGEDVQHMSIWLVLATSSVAVACMAGAVSAARTAEHGQIE